MSLFFVKTIPALFIITLSCFNAVFWTVSSLSSQLNYYYILEPIN